jgi:hypothetical protein
LQALLNRTTLELHAAWEAVFLAHLVTDANKRFFEAEGCQIEIALKESPSV